MISYDTILDSLLPLKLVEQAFRHIYHENIPLLDVEKTPGVMNLLKDDPDAERIVRSICSEVFEKHYLTEKKIFSNPDTDVLAQTHIRFHPAIEHSHDFFEIQYVLQGKFRQTIDCTEVVLTAGDFCFIAPNVSHNLYVFDEDIIVINLLIKKRVFSYSFFNLLSSSDLISTFFIRALYTEKSTSFLINRTCDDENIRFLILKLLATQKSGKPYTPQLIRTQFEELFLYILRDHSMDFIYAVNQKNYQNFLDILSYIQTNYTTVSLEVLAEKFQYNKSYLSRLIKQRTGKSFSQIVHDLRFNHAVELILTTNTRIEDIIANTGYSDRTYFYREFKRIYGTSPADYRAAKQAPQLV